MGDWFNDIANEHLRDSGWITLNVAYIAYAASSLFKDMLRLRVTLLIATVLYISYGVIADIWSMVWWNIPVGIIHAWRSWDLLRERRAVDLDTEAEAIRVLLYRDLDRVAFYRLWKLSEEEHFHDRHVLITQAEPVTHIMLILDGSVRVEANGRRVSELGRLRFIGEMSTLSGQHASASVRTTGPVRARTWVIAELEELLEQNAEIERAHLRAVGRDLARKFS